MSIDTTVKTTFTLTELPPRVAAPADSSINCFGHLLGVREKVSAEAFMSILSEQGYKPTEVPDAGDFVLYMGKNNLPVHAGILRQGGFVESKSGGGLALIHLMRASYIIRDYGGTICFSTKREQ